MLFPDTDHPWESKPLGQVFRLSTIGLNPKDCPRETFHHYSIPAWDECGGPVLDMGKDIDSGKFLLTQRCILVSKLNPIISRVREFLPPEDGRRACGSTEIMAFVPLADETSLAFYTQYFRGEGFRRNLVSAATGTTNSHKRVRPTETMGWLIPSPPPDEQAAIARILDAVDTAIARTREAVERARIVRETLLHQLLRFGIHCEKQKKSEAGLIPMSWDCEPLGNHLESGPTNGVYRPESDYGTEGTRIVRIDSFADGEIHDVTSLRRVKVEPAIEQRYLLYESDLLINRVNSLSHIGKAAIVPILDEPTIFESNMMALRCSKRLVPEFLILVLCSDIARRHWLSRAKPAVNQASINQRDVRVLPVPLPESDEQLEIANTISAAAKHIQCLDDVVKAQTQLKKSLMHDLLTGKVRVNNLNLAPLENSV